MCRWKIKNEKVASEKKLRREEGRRLVKKEDERAVKEGKSDNEEEGGWKERIGDQQGAQNEREEANGEEEEYPVGQRAVARARATCVLS